METNRRDTSLDDACAFANVVSPRAEMEAWETLWGVQNQTQKTLSTFFRDHAVQRPTQALAALRSTWLLSEELDEIEENVARFLEHVHDQFSVCVRGTFHYPTRLREATYPVELFYYRGDIGYLERPCVSIVGARACTEEGSRRAARLSRELSEFGFAIVSGLAAGIDTAAMTAAIECGGTTIGVIGTPVNESYPKENADLQEEVASEHLLVSQVPFYRYSQEPWTAKRRYFPQRNETMAALSLATIIVEASETSGTHTQARAALKHNRPLFILNSCFEKGLTWPAQYEKQGAIRVQKTDDIIDALKDSINGFCSTTLEADGRD